MMSDANGGRHGNAGVKPIAHAKADAEALSAGLEEIIDLDGEMTNVGPGVRPCEGDDADKFYLIRSGWSLWGPPAEKMRVAMDRLIDEMPKKGWTITEHGREKSVARDRYLRATNEKAKFSVHIGLLEPSPNSRLKKPLFKATLVSGCFEVPEGASAENAY